MRSSRARPSWYTNAQLVQNPAATLDQWPALVHHGPQYRHGPVHPRRPDHRQHRRRRGQHHHGQFAERHPVPGRRHARTVQLRHGQSGQPQCLLQWLFRQCAVIDQRHPDAGGALPFLHCVQLYHLQADARHPGVAAAELWHLWPSRIPARRAPRQSPSMPTTRSCRPASRPSSAPCRTATMPPPASAAPPPRQPRTSRSAPSTPTIRRLATTMSAISATKSACPACRVYRTVTRGVFGLDGE